MPDAEKTEIGAKRTLPGTIDALCVSYYRSEAWLNLAEGTRKGRRPVIERFRERHGSKCVALLRHEHIANMLAAIGTVMAKRWWLAAIRPLLQHAVPTMVKDDPMAGEAGGAASSGPATATGAKRAKDRKEVLDVIRWLDLDGTMNPRTKKARRQGTQHGGIVVW